MWKPWTAVLALLVAIWAVSTIGGCGDDAADSPRRGVAVDHAGGGVLRLDLPLLRGLEARRVVAEEPGDDRSLEAVEAASTIVAVAEPWPPSPTEAVDERWRITIYSCIPEGYCGATASGVVVAPGMAACSDHWPFGTRFQIRGDVAHPRGVVCMDRGSGVLDRRHLDIFFDKAEEGWAFLREVGTQVEVEVIVE
jgi:3D (Asp-Asp-Asp) domain-containing protein